MFTRQLLVTIVVGIFFAGCSKSESSPPSSSNPNAKSASEAVQSRGGGAAATAEPTVIPNPETCPPGGKCDGYCAPDQKQVANGAQCWACTSKECDAPFDRGCAESPDPKTCEAILQCFHRTNCLVGGVVPCYCGDNPVDTCVVKGPSGGKCTDVIASGFPKGMPAGLLIKSFGDPKTAGGFATGIGLCIGNFCSKKCVPYCASTT